MSNLSFIIEKIWSTYGAASPNTSKMTAGAGGENRRGAFPGKPEYPIKEEEKKHSGFFVALKVAKKYSKIFDDILTEDPEDLHITLFYTKSGDKEQRNECSKVAEKILLKHGPVFAEVSGVGVFEPSESSDGKFVTYAKVESQQILSLREILVNEFSKCGVITTSTFSFTPHITLAYTDDKPESKSIKRHDIRLNKAIISGV